MKVAFLSESPADKAALTVLVGAILERPIEVPNIDPDARSLPSLFNQIGPVVRALHFGSDAEALVVVVDGDESAPHDISHVSSKEQSSCHFCKLIEEVAQARKRLRKRDGQQDLKIALGVAVPAIEAWYLVGKNHEVGEARWLQGINSKEPPFDKRAIKKEVYATERPSLELEIKIATDECRRLAGDVGRIVSAFPIGFGLLSDEIQSWK